MKQSTRHYPALAAFIAVFFWASAFPVVKYCLRYYSPEALMLFRFLIASAILLGYCFLKKIPPPKLKDFPLLLLSGCTGIFGYMWAFNAGTNMVTSGISSFIIASGPVFTLILSTIFLKEKTPLLGWTGILLSLLGLILVAYGQVAGVELNWGVAVLIAAAVLAAMFNVTQRKLLAKYTAMQSMAYTVALGTLFMLIFTPALFTEIKTAPSSTNWLIIYLAVFPAALSYFLWGYALEKANKTSQIIGFLYLSPFIATLIAFVWLKEIIPFLSLTGGLIIIAGMIISNRAKR